MKLDSHLTIIERYFFSYIDRGIDADETPLFTLALHGRPLADVISEQFELPMHCAEAAIELARREVAL